MSKPDEVYASAPQYDPHPDGQFVIACMDCINLGRRLEQFAGKPERLVDKVALVFQSGEVNREGRLHEVTTEFSLSMGQKANLRIFLESWRGKSYTDDQAQRVPLHKLVGQPGLASIEHRTSGSGRVYAKIKTIAPLPKGMLPPTLPLYERPDFFAERIEEYAKEVASYMERIAPRPSQSFDDPPAGLVDSEDDDLPF